MSPLTPTHPLTSSGATARSWRTWQLILATAVAFLVGIPVGGLSSQEKVDDAETALAVAEERNKGLEDRVAALEATTTTAPAATTTTAPVVTTTTSPAVVPATSAAPTTTTEPGNVVPSVKGQRFDLAKAHVIDAGFSESDIEVIGGGTFGVIDESAWEVCGQEPAAGQRTDTVRLIVDRSGSC